MQGKNNSMVIIITPPQYDTLNLSLRELFLQRTKRHGLFPSFARCYFSALDSVFKQIPEAIHIKEVPFPLA